MRSCAQLMVVAKECGWIDFAPWYPAHMCDGAHGGHTSVAYVARTVRIIVNSAPSPCMSDVLLMIDELPAESTYTCRMSHCSDGSHAMTHNAAWCPYQLIRE